MSREVRLQAMFPACQNAWTQSTTSWGPYPFTGNQACNFDTKIIGGIPRPYAWVLSTIDLAKMEMDKDTLFPIGVAVQDPGLYVSSEPTNKSMVVIDLITTKMIDPSLIVNFSGFHIDESTGSMYGMLGSSDDGTQILYGQYRLMTGNANLPALADTLRTEWANNFSSGEPSAADKLYCYRIVQIFGNADAQMYVPASRFYLSAAIDAEPDLEYMMRLKRSYELDQTQS